MPSYPVAGEGLPWPMPWALSALGVLLAANAVWLASQTTPMTARPGQASARSPVATRTAPDAAAVAPGASAPSGGPAFGASQAGGPVAVAATLPPCPPAAAIYFPTGKSTPELPDMVSVVLAPVIDWARQNPSARLSVEGNANAVGEDKSNLLLSYTRAKAVAALLTDKGIAAQQLQVTAAGSRLPAGGRAASTREDRRVTIQLHDPARCSPSTR